MILFCQSKKGTKRVSRGRSVEITEDIEINGHFSNMCVSFRVPLVPSHGYGHPPPADASDSHATSRQDLISQS
jgi:hypothetical protein